MHSLPRLHLRLMYAICGFNLVALVLLELPIFGDSNIQTDNASVSIADRAQSPETPEDNQLPAQSALGVLQKDSRFPEVQIRRGVRWQAARIGFGDTIPSLLARRGIKRSEIAALDAVPEFQQQEDRIRTGALVEYQIDDAGMLRTVRYPLSDLESNVFARDGSRFSYMHEVRTPERRVVMRKGTVARSLFLAGQRAGLTGQLTMSLAQVFQWDIDFALDIRPGDSFALVYEELYVDGRRVGSGNILAAEFTNRGERHQAVRYARDGSQPAYYALNGRSTRKAFLKAPLEFSRVSSNFTMRRFHPILKTFRPHRGIDYSAPVGTPVWAAGDGKVILATSDSSSGRHIVLQHGRKYQTKYLHLSRFAKDITAGQRVHQGQVIGYVGTTGLATGPHLHFEFIEGGVHKNPSTANMMEGPISGHEKSKFDAQAGVLMAAMQGGPMDAVALAKIAND